MDDAALMLDATFTYQASGITYHSSCTTRQPEPADHVDAILDAPARGVDLTVGQEQPGRQPELQGGKRAAQVFAADDVGLAGAAVAPQRQLGLVDPLVAVDARVAGP